MLNKIKISIGIPAYNESKNIGFLLSGIFAQKFSKNVELLEIIVASDGSTDKTCETVAKFKDKRIRLFEGKERKSKNFRLNQIFEQFSGDMLILLDADIAFYGKNVINNVVKPFGIYSNVGLVAGNVQPFPARTLAASAFNNYIASLNFIKKNIKNGNNVYSVRGPLLALSHKFAKGLNIPPEIPDDRYLYFACLKNGFKFRYEEKAKVFFKSPTTMEEQIIQGKRFIKDRENLFKKVDSNLINGEYYVPLKLKTFALFLQLIKNPVAYIAMKYIQFKVITNDNKKRNARWRVARTTKNLT